MPIRNWTGGTQRAGRVEADEFDAGAVNGVVRVQGSEDLPNASGGTHTLDAMTAYQFDGIISSQAGIELGPTTPLVGVHGSYSGFQHTGSGAAIISNGDPIFMDALVVHSADTIFDATADSSTEILITESAFFDFMGMGTISDLGTIDGYRVPSFKTCSFEDFDSGLTFTGTSDKLYIANTPIRNVQDGATAITFSSGDDTEHIDISEIGRAHV